jgi:type II secretory pathway pseudopilin PulG
MALSATLNSPMLTAMPGDTTTCDIQVRNTGQVVDQYALGLLGDVQEWATVEPPVLNLYPGEAGTARITFSPPRSSKVHAGVVPFGLRIASREDPHGSRVEEGQVEILPFEDVKAELVPHVSSGRRSARFDLAVDNLGNYPMDVELFAEDPNDQLRFRLTRAAATVAPGTATLIRFQARPRKGFLKGQDKSHPFVLVVAPRNAEPVNADGAMVQQPLLPRWLLPALAALLAVILILVVLWFTVLKPTIQSTARAEAQQQNQQLAAAVQALRQQAAQNGSGSGAGGAKAGAGGGAAGGGAATPPSGSATAPIPPPPAPAAFRLGTTAPANQAPGTFTVTNLPASMQGVPLGISDMLFQNPAGDTGDLQIRKKTGSTTVVLADFSLVNFRDEDYHLLQPWEFTKTDQLQIAVSCQNGTGKPVTGACTAGVSFSGLAG